MGYMGTNYWEITDNNGVIHSGDEDKMRQAFDAMTLSTADLQEQYDLSERDANKLMRQWFTEYEGDLKLVEVHNVCR